MQQKQVGRRSWASAAAHFSPRKRRAAARPDAEAPVALTGAERGLLHTYYHGPLRGVTVSPELMRDLLAEAHPGGSVRASLAGGVRTGRARR